MTQAVLFDAGQTLIHVKQGVGRVYVETAARYGVQVVPETVGRSFRRFWDERRDSLHLGTSEEMERQWWRDLVADVFDAAGAREQFGGRFEEFFQELYEIFSQPDVWQVYDDVLPALTMLEESGIRRAVVSNWDSRLPILLKRLDLRRYFEFVLTSAQAGYRKPDPRIFQQALDRLHLEPEQVVHVGDSYEDDVAGARNAHIRAFLVDRAADGRGDTDAIHSLAELDRICRRARE